MLRACNKVLRQGGRVGFHVIHTADGLSGADHRKALESGPEHVEAEAPYGELLQVAGFTAVETTDVTEEYRRILAARIAESRPFTDELRSIYGADIYDERQEGRTKALAAIDAGLLERSLFVGTKPSG